MLVCKEEIIKRKRIAAIALLILVGIVLTGCNPLGTMKNLAPQPGASAQSKGGGYQIPTGEQTYFTGAGGFCNGFA